MQWHSRVVPRPLNWNPVEQFSRVGTVLVVSGGVPMDFSVQPEPRLERMVPSYIIADRHASISTKNRAND